MRKTQKREAAVEAGAVAGDDPAREQVGRIQQPHGEERLPLQELVARCRLHFKLIPLEGDPVGWLMGRPDGDGDPRPRWQRLQGTLRLVRRSAAVLRPSPVLHGLAQLSAILDEISTMVREVGERAYVIPFGLQPHQVGYLPKARTAEGVRFLQELREAFRAGRVDLELLPTEPAGAGDEPLAKVTEAEELAREIDKQKRDGGAADPNDVARLAEFCRGSDRVRGDKWCGKIIAALDRLKATTPEKAVSASLKNRPKDTAQADLFQELGIGKKEERVISERLLWLRVCGLVRQVDGPRTAYYLPL